jgi:hypothetical protein
VREEARGGWGRRRAAACAGYGCATMKAGLCDTCRHQRVVRTTRGSAFSLCLRSKAEPDAYPRYPRLPVTECRGWEARRASSS